MKVKNSNLKPALLVLLALMLAGYACTRVEDNTRSASLLIVGSVTGDPGTEGEDPGPVLMSDVCDGDTGCSIFNDNAVVGFRNEFLQVGPGAGTSPTFLNDIIVNRYRVDYFRPNGRNVPGVDVPYGIDGTMNVFVASGGVATTSIVVVRHVAKREPPLAELAFGPSEFVLTANAELRFYGQDISGRAVSANGFLEIHFADYGE